MNYKALKKAGISEQIKAMISGVLQRRNGLGKLKHVLAYHGKGTYGG